MNAVNKNGNRMKYAVAGGLAGIISGLLGTGGGLVLVPLLIRWIKLEDKKAFASSIAIIAPLCVVSSVVYLIHGSIEGAAPYLIGGLLGGLLAGKIYGKVPGLWLRRGFAVLMLFGGLRSLGVL